MALSLLDAWSEGHTGKSIAWIVNIRAIVSSLLKLRRGESSVKEG
jgi:hypothetical protein